MIAICIWFVVLLIIIHSDLFLMNGKIYKMEFTKNFNTTASWQLINFFSMQNVYLCIHIFNVLIRNIENIQKKLINCQLAVVFNETCSNIHIYTYIYSAITTI